MVTTQRTVITPMRARGKGTADRCRAGNIHIHPSVALSYRSRSVDHGMCHIACGIVWYGVYVYVCSGLSRTTYMTSSSPKTRPKNQYERRRDHGGADHLLHLSTCSRDREERRRGRKIIRKYLSDFEQKHIIRTRITTNFEQLL